MVVSLGKRLEAKKLEGATDPVLDEKQPLYRAGSVGLCCASEMYNMSPWLLNLQDTPLVVVLIHPTPLSLFFFFLFQQNTAQTLDNL